jgi:membrane-anchored protein YejM (alkaline phosphatase superfamily)
MGYLKTLWDLIIIDGSKYVISTSALLISLPILIILLLLLLFCGDSMTNLMEAILK